MCSNYIIYNFKLYLYFKYYISNITKYNIMFIPIFNFSLIIFIDYYLTKFLINCFDPRQSKSFLLSTANHQGIIYLENLFKMK